MRQILLDTLAALLPILLLVIGNYLRQIINRGADALQMQAAVSIDDTARAALHSALMTGITAALSRGLGGQVAIEAGIAHAVSRGAPDAIEHFGLSVQGLQTLAEAKLWEARQRQLPVAELIQDEIWIPPEAVPAAEVR